MQETLRLPDITLPVVLKRSSRRRAISLLIKQGQLIVQAPIVCPVPVILDFLSQKKAWIQSKTQLHQQQLTEAPPTYPQSGDTYCVLGQPQTLMIQAGKYNQVLHHPPNLQLQVTQPTCPKAIKQTLRQWFRQQTLQQAQQRCAHYGAQMHLYPSAVKVRAYRARWGCCHRNGTLTFHELLYMAPQFVFNAIIVHELAHLKHPNHSRTFWQLVAQYDPAYRTAMAWLKQHPFQIAL